MLFVAIGAAFFVVAFIRFTIFSLSSFGRVSYSISFRSIKISSISLFFLLNRPPPIRIRGMAEFSIEFKKIIAVEGSAYTNYPNDRGGPTKFGITLVSLREWKNNPNLVPSDIQALNEKDAELFYLEMFWNKINGDQIVSQDAASVLLNQAVNRGLRTTSVQAQKIINKYGFHLVLDGVFGKASTVALNQLAPKSFLLDFIFESQHNYINILLNNSTQAEFIHGWINRTQELLRRVASMPA